MEAITVVHKKHNFMSKFSAREVVDNSGDIFNNQGPRLTLNCLSGACKGQIQPVVINTQGLEQI